MAILGWGLGQCGVPVFCLTRDETGGFLASNPKRKLLVDFTRRSSLLCRCVGTRLALALFAGTDQENPDKQDFPGHLHRVHGK